MLPLFNFSTRHPLEACPDRDRRVWMPQVIETGFGFDTTQNSMNRHTDWPEGGGIMLPQRSPEVISITASSRSAFFQVSTFSFS